MSLGGESAPRRLSVVVADDIRGLIVIATTKAGLEVVADASDGQAALDAIRRLTPDLAILDITMPKLSGIDVCRAVRQDPSLDDVRLLLLSASVDEASRATGLESGADHFLAKPFSVPALVDWLKVGKEPRP
jgi:DNA-binding response OmpR family regulator